MMPSIRRFAAVAACFFLVGAAHAAADVKITEFMYSSAGSGGEFIEFTNVGDAAQDMTGWSFDDDSRTPGSVDLSAFGTLQPGESAILTESAVADFRSAWNLCASQKIIGGNTDNLGSADEINLYDNTGAQADRLTYGASGTIKAKGFSGIPITSAALGANDITQWQLSAVGDAEHSYTSTYGDVGSPGKSSLITAGAPTCKGPLVRITEYMYDSTSDGEFIEIANVGDATQDMTGWSFDDSTRTPGSLSLSTFGTLQPGETAIITDLDAATFRTHWSLCGGQKVIGGNTQNLGREDEINIYDAGSNLIDRLTYGDQTFAPGSIRTQNASGWVSAAGLGQNLIADWTKSVVGDSEGSYAASGGAIGSPGKTTRVSSAFDPCIGTPGSPTIAVDAGATSPRLNLAVNGTGAASGVLSDPTDPASTVGIGFIIASTTFDVSQLTVTVTSSDTTVVPAANLVLTGTGTGASRQLTITPAAVGYSTITVLVRDPSFNEGAYVIDYGASAASPTPATSRFFTGTSDTSSGIAIDDQTMLVGDDENQGLRLYSRDNSGWPLVPAFDFTTNLQLTDLDAGVPREVDIEASARLNDRVFWSGSHSNSDDGDLRPDRNRVFATDLSGSGAATTLAYAGRYDFLRDDLIAWDSGNGHGLGANALGFTASTAAGVGAKQNDGFNIEGMAIAPDGTSAFMAFRAPLLPTTSRTMALLVPLHNVDDLVTGSGAVGSKPQNSATFGAPILLDLAGRGIREIVRNGAGQYLIIAGPSGDDTGVAPLDFRLFTWTGNAADKPIELDTDLTALAARGSWESIIGFPDTVGPQTPVQLLTDSGDTDWYGDGVIAKSLPEKQLSKFRGDRLIINVPLASDVLYRDGFDQR